jgi:hypothetical protein
MTHERHCPHCGGVIQSLAKSMEKKVDNLDGEWREVAVGASRYYLGKLEARYPQAEFRHERLGLFGDVYRIEARRAP